MLLVLHNYSKAHPGMALPATQQLAIMLLGGRLPDHASLEYLKHLVATYLGPGLKASRKAKAAAEEDIIAAKVGPRVRRTLPTPFALHGCCSTEDFCLEHGQRALARWCCTCVDMVSYRLRCCCRPMQTRSRWCRQSPTRGSAACSWPMSWRLYAMRCLQRPPKPAWQPPSRPPRRSWPRRARQTGNPKPWTPKTGTAAASLSPTGWQLGMLVQLCYQCVRLNARACSDVHTDGLCGAWVCIFRPSSVSLLQ